jgi:long-chain fatty acid transport protein
MFKRHLIIALAVILVLPALASANGLNLNGLGTRAQAMGGAYVSLANDFSAVFWNPAGAAGFRKDMFGFYALDLAPRATYRLDLMGIPEKPPAVDAKTPTAHYLGFLGAYYKPVSSTVVIGLGVGTPSGLGTKWDGQDFASLSGGTAFDWSSKVGVFSVSPLVAVKLNEWLSVGATLNVNLGTFNLKMPGGSADLGEGTVPLGQYEEQMTGWGFGATFGLMAKPTEKLGIGLTLRTPSTVSFKGSASLSYLSMYDLPGSSDLKRKITWPLWIAGGISFRPVERLLLSADVQWTQWSKLDRITTDYLDGVWAALMVAGHKDIQMLNWKDATQVRFGAEYVLNGTTAVRAGYYNDPAPGPDSTLNVLLPTYTFNAFSVGLGKTLGDLQLDFGLEYLAGNKRQPPGSNLDSGMFGTYTMRIVVPSVSVQYKF